MDLTVERTHELMERGDFIDRVAQIFENIEFLQDSPDGWDCWVYRENRRSGRYAKIKLNGSTVYLHRFLKFCSCSHGPYGSFRDPENHSALHSCGNAWCVNPSHIRYGDHKENAADAKRHGTLPSGEDHANARLSNEAVQAIRESYADGTTQAVCARHHGISQSTVSKIVLGKRRTEAGGPIKGADY
jgi:hypothetical protein